MTQLFQHIRKSVGELVQWGRVMKRDITPRSVLQFAVRLVFALVFAGLMGSTASYGYTSNYDYLAKQHVTVAEHAQQAESVRDLAYEKPETSPITLSPTLAAAPSQSHVFANAPPSATVDTCSDNLSPAMAGGERALSLGQTAQLLAAKSASLYEDATLEGSGFAS